MNIWQQEIDTKGYYEWKVTVARKAVVGRIDHAALEDFASWDTSIVWDQFPPCVHVLTLHGTADETVPVYVLDLSLYPLFADMITFALFSYDALIYARALGTRSPGTHNLHLIEDADHNFTGVSSERITSAFVVLTVVCCSGKTKSSIISWSGGNYSNKGNYSPGYGRLEFEANYDVRNIQ